jgi:thioredoxin-dependent peroxiredoxin
MIETGQPAPDFTLPDQNGDEVTLSDFRGRTVVLYFYPKADTPGCTAQACGVRDHTGDYAAADAVVLGVSPDPVEAIKAFEEKHGLNFPLLSDEGHRVTELYGAWGEKQMYGRKYMGVLRTTFVIDADGNVAEVLENVNARKHDDLVLGALGERAPS